MTPSGTALKTNECFSSIFRICLENLSLWFVLIKCIIVQTSYLMSQFSYCKPMLFVVTYKGFFISETTDDSLVNMNYINHRKHISRRNESRKGAGKLTLGLSLVAGTRGCWRGSIPNPKHLERYLSPAMVTEYQSSQFPAVHSNSKQTMQLLSSHKISNIRKFVVSCHYQKIFISMIQFHLSSA